MPQTVNIEFLIDVTIHFPNGDMKNKVMNRPFINEKIWIDRATYRVIDIIHIGQSLNVYLHI